VTNNTGYFAQAQFGFRDALFLTGGLRAEQNTNFGEDLGTPVSPQAGVSYVRQFGPTSVKVRGSWGRAIRAPAPGLKSAVASAISVQLANSQLGPERQKGWDAGIDMVIGARGSLSLTYYDQSAEDLIQSVLLQTNPVQTFQSQNVGRVKNTGVEVEGTFFSGPLQLKAQYGYSRARIEQLAPNYTGDLQVGDQALITPKHTAGVSLTVTPLATTTLSAGLTYVGGWNYYDFLALYGCFGGTSPCASGPGFRGYIAPYPGFAKLNASVSQQITRFASGFVSVDNVANNQAFEAANTSPVLGRIMTAGFQLRY